jgi:hypothetical protein
MLAMVVAPEVLAGVAFLPMEEAVPEVLVAILGTEELAVRELLSPAE